MNAAVLVFDGVGDLDAFGPYEVLANASVAGADVTVRLVTLEPSAEVRTSHGATIRPDGALGEGLEPDLVVVPGGGWNTRANHGAWAEAERGAIPVALHELHERGATVASVCTGAGILAASGLLDGRPASTHRRAREDLESRGVEVVDARVVDDGEVLSAGGVTAGLDLALRVVEREWGRAMADGIAREMEYERRGPLHLGPSSAG